MGAVTLEQLKRSLQDFVRTALDSANRRLDDHIGHDATQQPHF